MKTRFDAWRKPILEHFELISYYSGDGKSMAVIRNNMAHRFACLPFVTIEVDPLDLQMVRVERVFPGGSEAISLNRSERCLGALRRLYAHPRGGWKVLRVGGKVRFTHKGVAIVATGSHSGWIS